MSSAATWLYRLGHLNLYQARHGRAPHKPLLLLVILELAERGELPSDILVLTAELAYRFDTYWTVVRHRRTQPPDVRMPFHHLTGDGVWTAFTAAGLKSPHRSVTTHVRLNPEFVGCTNEATFRHQGTPTGCSTVGCGRSAMITELLWPRMRSPKLAPIRGRLRTTAPTRCVCRETNRCGPTLDTSRGTASTDQSSALRPPSLACQFLGLTARRHCPTRPTADRAIPWA